MRTRVRVRSLRRYAKSQKLEAKIVMKDLDVHY